MSRKAKPESEIEVFNNLGQLENETDIEISMDEKEKNEIKSGELKMAAVKMSVVRYLQKYPQPNYVAVLLKAKYKSETHTKEEWDAIVENLMVAKLSL